MLQVKDLNYRIRNQFGAKTGFAISNIDFELEDGYLMGLLGKNGAGKSTLLRLLYGVLPPDSGSVWWNGRNMSEYKQDIRQEIAYVGDLEAFLPEHSMEVNVDFLGKLYRSFSMERFQKYLDIFELETGVLKKELEELSAGQQMRLQLAFAFSRKPKLLLLDEPTTNLDPVFRVDFMELLQKIIATEQSSIILSTHILEDMEDIVDYIGVMEQGALIKFGNREEVMKEHETLQEVLCEVQK